MLGTEVLVFEVLGSESVKAGRHHRPASEIKWRFKGRADGGPTLNTGSVAL